MLKLLDWRCGEDVVLFACVLLLAQLNLWFAEFQ